MTRKSACSSKKLGIVAVGGLQYHHDQTVVLKTVARSQCHKQEFSGAASTLFVSNIIDAILGHTIRIQETSSNTLTTMASLREKKQARSGRFPDLYKRWLWLS